MKTKFLPALLALALLASLAACGEPSSAESAAPESAAPDLSPAIFNSEPAIEPTVLLDKDGVKITADSLSYSEYDAELNLTIENTSGKNLSFSSGTMGYSCNSVNGYMVSGGYMSCDVADGKKAKESVSFDYDSLLVYGIDEIADLEMGFAIRDEDYNYSYTGPLPLKTTAYDAHDYGVNRYQEAISGRSASLFGYETVWFSDESLYDENGVKQLSSALLRSESGEPAMLLEFENTGDSMLYLSAENVAINGLATASLSWATGEVNPGKRYIMELELSSILDPAYWEPCGIEELASVALTVVQEDAESRDTAPARRIELEIPGAEGGFDPSGAEVCSSGGIRIVFKGLMDDDSGYSSDVIALLLAENNSGRPLYIACEYDSLSVNGYMADAYYYGPELEDGQSGVIELRLPESSLEELDIASAADIAELELGFEFRYDSGGSDSATVAIPLG